jgi:hypothetical protein
VPRGRDPYPALGQGSVEPGRAAQSPVPGARQTWGIDLKLEREVIVTEPGPGPRLRLRARVCA